MTAQYGDGSRWRICRLRPWYSKKYRYWILPPGYVNGPAHSFPTFEAARAAFAAGHK